MVHVLLHSAQDAKCGIQHTFFEVLAHSALPLLTGITEVSTCQCQKRQWPTSKPKTANQISSCSKLEALFTFKSIASQEDRAKSR